MAESSILRIMCSDNVILEVNKAEAANIELLSGIAEDADPEDDPVPILVKSNILEKVLEYCRYTLDHEPPMIEKPLRTTDFS